MKNLANLKGAKMLTKNTLMQINGGGGIRPTLCSPDSNVACTLPKVCHQLPNGTWTCI